MSEQRVVQHDERPAGLADCVPESRDHDGRTGSSWVVSTKTHNSDVVIAHREGGRWVHDTFHEGEWHIAVSNAGQALHPEVSAYPLRLPTVQPSPGGWALAGRITVAVGISLPQRMGRAGSLTGLGWWRSRRPKVSVSSWWTYCC